MLSNRLIDNIAFMLLCIASLEAVAVCILTKAIA